MNRTTLTLIALIGLSLTACQETNPLQGHNSKELAEWLYQHRTPAIEQCGKSWAGQNSITTAPESCEKTAEKLATMLTDSGFGNIKASNVKLPTIWIAFNERTKAASMHRYDAKKAADAMRMPQKSSKSRKEQEAEARAKARKALVPNN